jgi:hypothetical protein
MSTQVAKKPKPKKQVGRKGLLTKELSETIAGYVRVGVYVEEACGAAGIARATFYQWLERGRAERERIKLMKAEGPKPSERIYVEFLDMMERAYDEATLRKVAVITKSAESGDWRAASWWLERTRPAKYGLKAQVEHTGENGEPIRVQVEIGDLEEKVSRVLALRKE